MQVGKIPARPYNDPRRTNPTAVNPQGFNSSQLLECRHSQPQTPPQLPGRSASDLLQNYIDQFERTESAGGHQDRPQVSLQQLPGLTGIAQYGHQYSALPPELPPTTEDDRDTLELLCGTSASNPHVSVKARCLLRDAEKELGHMQPCYSVSNKLDLRTVWPSMHEHLERRWRQQIRARFEAQQRQEADAAAAAKTIQGSRAELFKSQWASNTWRHQTSLPFAPKVKGFQHKAEPPGQDKEYTGDDEETEKATDSEAGSIAGEAVRTDDEVDEDDADGGRPWGSDSGLGLSFTRQHQQHSASPTQQPSEKKLDRASSAAQPQAKSKPQQIDNNSVNSDHEEAADEEFSDQQSFDERMHSYRYVLEAHALSSQLRQRLETACTSAGGPRALTAEQKGRIRERLTQLQHPEFRLPSASDDSPPPPQPLPSTQTQKLPEPKAASRITTERLTRLMRSARGLLAESECRLSSCRQLCDSIQNGRRTSWAEQGGQQQ